MIYRALPTGPLVFGVFGGNGFCSVLRRPIKNQRTGTGIDILPAAFRVMAKRCATFARCRKANRSGVPDAALWSAIFASFENSPAIYGWVHGSGMFQVPSGTKELFCRP